MEGRSEVLKEDEKEEVLHPLQASTGTQASAIKEPEFIQLLDRKSDRCWRGPTPKYKHLLADQDVRRWYDNVCRGSRLTADNYLRHLGYLCVTKGMKNGPRELLELSVREGDRWAYNFLIDVVSELERKGRAGSYIEVFVKAVKSWLIHNGVEVKGKIKIKGADDTPTLRDKRTLTNPELALFFSSAPPQTRCAAVLIAESGLRLESVGNYDGTDGIRVRDIPEMRIEESDGVDAPSSSDPRVTFMRIPAMLVVRRELSKTRHQYFTFLTPEACRQIAEYLTQRIKAGENLSSSSPLVTPRHDKPSKNPFVRTTLVSDLIRTRLRACRINSRPYDLRATFDTHLMLAESRGLMMRDYRVFFMGHKGDVEHRYTTNKETLQHEVIEDMRSSFARAQGYLQSGGLISEEQDIRSEMRKQLLLASGFTDAELGKMNLSSMSSEEFHGAIKRKLLGEMANNGSKQKVVSLSEVEQYISNGWEFVAALSNEKAILKLPF